MKVWYASYGSNILEERFMTYIVGGKPVGSKLSERGCRNQTPPKRKEKFEIPFPLYFAKERSKWGKGGVAFIDHTRSIRDKTIGAMYLITDEQFTDVVAQENNQQSVKIDFEAVMTNGYAQIGAGWYGRIVYLGDKEGAPIFTFTNHQAMEEVIITTPSSAYLRTIAKGILELGYHHDELLDYFMNKQGIGGRFSKKELADYLST